MKKQFFVLIFFTLPFFATAQEQQKNFQLGFTGSPNIGWIRVTDNSIPDMTSDGVRAGFSYGVLADMGFAANYFFSTGFMVSSINGKSSFTAPNSGAGSDVSDYTYKIQYLEVPITLKLKSNENPAGRFYGQFGLGTGVRISARQDLVRRGPTGTFSDTDVNISEEVSTFRLSLIAGGGAEWKIGPNLNLLTGITLNNGFTNTLEETDDMRNSYLALTLGVFF